MNNYLARLHFKSGRKFGLIYSKRISIVTKLVAFTRILIYSYWGLFKNNIINIIQKWNYGF